MVARSNINYELHKKQVKEEIAKRFGEKRAEKFIEFYSSRWDKFGRSYLDYRFAFSLTDDYYHVRNIGTLLYAIVGAGGTGKTTLAVNMFYYLDPTLDIRRANITSTHKFVSVLDEYKKTGAKKAIFMDEPDDNIAATSKVGKKLREVAGKWRQQQLFLGICATDVVDIPTYLFRKLHGIIFLPCHGKGMFFRNCPNRERYVIQSMRLEYQKLGWKVFYKYKNTEGHLLFKTHKGIVFDSASYKEYLKEKEEDYAKSIKELKNMLDKVHNQSRNIELVKSLREKGLKYSEIVAKTGLTKGRISQIINTPSQ